VTVGVPESFLKTRSQSSGSQSWFVASLGEEPAGAIRLIYDPPLELPAELGVTLEPEVDLEGLKRHGRFVDIGRFMIVPAHRRNVRVAMRLMKAAIAEVVGRGYTHFLTDVFADDPHSPLQFHTRVLGFERIGTHRTEELACESVRIILILDIGRAYQRLKRRRNKGLPRAGRRPARRDRRAPGAALGVTSASNLAIHLLSPPARGAWTGLFLLGSPRPFHAPGE